MEKEKLIVGDNAPIFKLPATNGAEVGLKDFLRKKRVVLYFYPKDNTPGCTKEACSFRDNFNAIDCKDAAVLGVSLDNLESHQKFIKKQDLPFLLLSDEKCDVSKDYGVYKLKNMYGKKYWGIMRTTFVIDKKGKIEKIFFNVKPDGHAQQIVNYLSAS